MSLQASGTSRVQTIREYMADRKVLESETSEFRAKVSLPDYLGWNNYQWYNRKAGRTLLKDVEIKVMDIVLKEIRMKSTTI